MAKRRAGELDRVLELWARWLSFGSCVALGGGDSILARWMDAKGHMIYGGGGSREPVDTLESRIEHLVHLLGKSAGLSAEVLRLEYAAGADRVAVSRGWNGYRGGLGQLEHALLLNISLRTYRRRLQEAREYIAKHIGVAA